MNTEAESQQNWTDGDIEAKAAEIVNCEGNDKAMEIFGQVPADIQPGVATAVCKIIAEKEEAKGGPLKH